MKSVSGTGWMVVGSSFENWRSYQGLILVPAAVVVQAALLSQVGEDSDFMPTNQTKTEGNDDQGFWGMAAMSAAEMKFDDPPAGLIGDAYEIYDGSSDTENCTVIDHGRFSYNQGIYLFGAAMMYNYTNASTIWQPRVAGLLNATSAFFSSTKIMYELCEPAQTDHPTGTCDTDQRSFKAYLSRWMAGTAKIAPFTHDTVLGGYFA
ncbi:putative mannan endo-1,6-alpha-mannosidase [Glarea lozoyensis 74030]|uniref:mannan endo-1,6-alpha-mannosidase n=1 Tax=Glarea lozoyensis (strain ATCC 74030 / MF5533) TaxID=1104152 RepID=H0EP24_GLAL7|nr:putative mannan endo-1,6-alpha-mannosidase [Glarea lozoyensis 74030]